MFGNLRSFFFAPNNDQTATKKDLKNSSNIRYGDLIGYDDENLFKLLDARRIFGDIPRLWFRIGSFRTPQEHQLP